MTQLEWNTATEWDNAQSESGVVHESVTNTDHDDATIVKQGYQIASPYKSADLVGYFPLHETSGSTAYDFSGNDHDGTYYGAGPDATGTVNGPLGTTAPDFDGNDDYINTLNDFGDSTNQVTLSVWFYPDRDGSSNVDVIIGKDESDERSWNLRINGDYVLEIHQAFGFLSAGTVTTGVWTHFVGTYDGSTGEVYVNGSLEGSVDDSGGIANTASTVAIGRRNYSGAESNFEGKIGDARIYDTAFSQSEVQTLYDIVNTQGNLTTATKTS